MDYDRAEEVALQRTLEEKGVVGDFQKQLDLYRKINQQLWDDFEEGKVTASDLKIIRFEQFLKAIDFYDSPKELSEAYLQKLALCDFLLPGAREILQELVGFYEMILLTNGLAEVQKSRLKKSSLDKYFATVVISEEVGVAKPHLDIFSFALEEINHHRKDDVLIIGDGIKSDILGGNNFGIDTCWFNPQRKINSTAIKPDYEICDLEEIKNILG